jgi:hypothetical protein
VYKCKITKNPCGTDTWANGFPCGCLSCREYLRIENNEPQNKIYCYCVCHFDSSTMHFMECCVGACKLCDSYPYKKYSDFLSHSCYGKEQLLKNPKGRWKLK